MKRQIVGSDPEPSVLKVCGQGRLATRNYGRGLEVSVQDQLRGIGIWTFSDVYVQIFIVLIRCLLVTNYKWCQRFLLVIEMRRGISGGPHIARPLAYTRHVPFYRCGRASRLGNLVFEHYFLFSGRSSR